MKKLPTRAFFVALAFALLWDMPAQAQDATNLDADTTDALAVEEIIVTALRRDTSLSTTPAAISAITGAQLISEGVTTVKDLQNVVPNLSNSVVGFAIRGVSSSDFTTKGDPAVAYNVNGIYLARYQEQQLALFDVERIEVLRGPQGTLYGRNATGGVVNVISVRPTNESKGYANLEVGNEGTFRGSAAFNAPLSDRAALRLAGTFNQRDPVTPTQDGYAALDDQDNYGIRASLLFQLSDSTDLLVTTDYNEVDEVGPANIASARALAQNDDKSLRYALPGVDNRNNIQSWGLVAELNSNLGWANLTYIGSYREYELDALSSKNDVLQFNQSDRVVSQHERDQMTHELRLASLSDGPLEWVAGAYYFEEKEDSLNYLNLCCFFTATFGFDMAVKAESYAAFGQVTYSLTDRVRLTGGLRWTKDDKERIGTQVLDLIGFGTEITPTVAPESLFDGQPVNNIGHYPGGKAPGDKTTWKLQIESDFGANVIGYAKVETGYKAGGFNDGTPDSDSPTRPFIYLPELVTDYELGIKGTVVDNSLYFALNLFQYDYENHQVVAVAPEGGAFTYNSPADVTGGEIEGWFRPAGNTTINFSASVLDATYGHFAPNGVDFKGRQLDFAPELTGRVGLVQDFPLANGGRIAGSIAVKYSDGYFVTDFINANDSFEQDSYTRTDISLGYFAPDDQWYVQAFGRNLEDERQLGVVEIGGFSLTDPRLYGVRAGYNF